MIIVTVKEYYIIQMEKTSVYGKEIAKIEYGDNFEKCCYIGRVYFKKPNTFYEGEI